MTKKAVEIVRRGKVRVLGSLEFGATAASVIDLGLVFALPPEEPPEDTPSAVASSSFASVAVGFLSVNPGQKRKIKRQREREREKALDARGSLQDFNSTS